MPAWQAHVIAAVRHRHGFHNDSTTTYRVTLIASRKIAPFQESPKIDLAGEPALVLGHVKGSSALWIKRLNPRPPEASVRFSFPKLPREVPDSGDESVTVVSATQPPKLFGYHPPD